MEFEAVDKYFNLSYLTDTSLYKYDFGLYQFLKFIINPMRKLKEIEFGT